MSRLALVLAASLALAGAGCSQSACQELGEKLCSCQPGATEDTCRTQVQDQLNQMGQDTPGFSGILDQVEAGNGTLTYEDYCQTRLDDCTGKAQGAGADFCQFLLTEAGKDACGVTPANPR